MTVSISEPPRRRSPFLSAEGRRSWLPETSALSALLVAGLFGIQGQAQNREIDSKPASFEVASVRVNRSDGTRPFTIELQQGGRFSATRVTLRMLVLFAYEIQAYQLVGGPDWLDSERFDILAKTADGDLDARGNMVPAGFRERLRSLLAERFKLKAYRESRQLPVFELIVDAADRRLGPRLQKSDTDCASLIEGGRGRPSSPPRIVRTEEVSSAKELGECRFASPAGRIIGNGWNMKQLATQLSMVVGRSVIDRTGLTGSFDWFLDGWKPEQTAQFNQSGEPLPPGTVMDDPSKPSILTALREQLGLKLQSARGPVDALVIETAERPTEN